MPGLPTAADRGARAHAARLRRTATTLREREAPVLRRGGRRWSPRATGPGGGWSRRTAWTRPGSRWPSPGSTRAARRPAARRAAACCASGAVTPGEGARRARWPRWRSSPTCAGAASASARWTGHRTSSPALRRDVRGAGLDDRFVLTGPRTGPDLDAAYAAADVLVLASRAETYGMVVTEALARGLPVLAADVGGVPEALGTGARRPTAGAARAAGRRDALAGALRRWLPTRTCAAACATRPAAAPGELAGWAETADRVARRARGGGGVRRVVVAVPGSRRRGGAGAGAVAHRRRTVRRRRPVARPADARARRGPRGADHGRVRLAVAPGRAGPRGRRSPLRPAVAACYRSQLLNTSLPGGVLGDVHARCAARSGRR